MKTITHILLLALWTSVSFAQSYYYYKGEKIPLKVSTDKIIIKFKKEIPFETKRKAISITSKIKPIPEKQAYRNNLVFAGLVESTTENELNQIITELNKNKKIEYANPYFLYSDSFEIGLTNQFIVKLQETTTYSELEELVKSTQTTLDRQDKYDKSIYIISTTKKSTGNALEIANYFYETGKFEFSEPNFISGLNLFTNDPLYPDQWAIKNTGQSSGTSNADMDVNQAWAITTGRDVIKVAVIDEGVELNHPDLVNNLLPGYDATGSGTDGGPISSTANHGTAAAGIISAEANNGIGIAGVAYDCTIIPISIDPINGSDIEVADAINWAWDNGEADVLSCSWGRVNSSSLIDAAISNAVTMGRGGLGSIVLFAAGNENESTVSYPASLSTTIAVGATDMCDARWDPTPCDGSFFTGGSNRGTALDIVAPGVKIKTTDINGSYANFTGTSAATPNATGVVALMLSVNRCLSEPDVKKILELSCDKPVFESSITDEFICYEITSGRPNGTWNNEMGYGRINAYNAVRYAFSLQTTTFFNLPGTDIEATDNFQWILIGGGCSQLAAATYIVKRHDIRLGLSYPFTQAPILIGTANGFSAANPNSGHFYMNVLNISSNSANVQTWVYEIISTISGQTVSWVPTDPSSIRFNVTVLSAIQTDLYFQNQTISTGTEVHNAMNKIEMGRNVTNAVPSGDFIIEGDANITFHAGNVGIMKPGTIIRPGPGGFVRMYVDPFFTCTQFPMGKKGNDDGGFPPVVKDYEVEKIEIGDDSSSIENAGIYLKNYPNPFTDNTTIEYRINKSETVTITIHDNCGRPLYKLKNKSAHEAGMYQIKLTGINLSSGIYYCTLQTETFTKTKELVVIK